MKSERQQLFADCIPHSTDDEAGALACVIESQNGDAERMLDKLSEDHFYDQRHVEVFRALLSIKEDGEHLNPIALHRRLADTGQLVSAGGFDYVANLGNKTPSPANFPTFLQTVSDRAARRQAIRESDRAKARALDISLPFIAAKVKTKLPAVEDGANFTSLEISEPQQLIWGVLHRGCKLALGGGSKTNKTWTLIDLALSVSHGEPWLSFKTTRARVCYVNLEIKREFFQRRLITVAREKQITIKPGALKIWNLRGHAASYSELLPTLAGQLKGEDIGLLIIDPSYKLYGTADENSARDVSAMLNCFEMLAQETGAAVAFASHFSKGNQAGKEAVDRISGSGVFARDPDAILTFTRHEQDGAFVVDSTLRNCKAVEPFVVRWDYPLMRCDGELDPSKLKQPNKGGRVATYSYDMIVACLGKRKMTTAQWQKRCQSENGITRPTFYRLLDTAKKLGLVTQNDKEKWSVSKVSKPASDTSDTSKSHNPLGYETTETSEKRSLTTQKP